MVVNFGDRRNSSSSITKNDEMRGSTPLIDMRRIHDEPSLLEDEDMSEKLYSDFEIAEHTVMLKGIPKNIPQTALEDGLKKLFDEFVANEGLSSSEIPRQVIKVVAVSDFNKCVGMYKSLKYNEGCLQKLNQ